MRRHSSSVAPMARRIASWLLGRRAPRRHACVSDGIIWVERYRLEIADNGPRKAVFTKSIPVEATAKISFVSLRIVCATFGQSHAFITGQMRNQCFCDVRGDRVFQTKHVSKAFIKLAGPNRRTVAHVEQLNSHAYAIPSAPDPAVEYEGGAEFPSGKKRIRLDAIAQHTACRPDGKTANGA